MSYFDLYRGARLSKPLISQLGRGSQGYGLLEDKRRGLLLADLVNQGKLDVNQLSPQDAKRAGDNMDKPQQSGIGGFFDSVGHGIHDVLGVGKNLGTDIFDAAKGLPVGLAQAGMGVAEQFPGVPDFGDPKGPHGFGERVLKPVVQSYEYTYGGKGANGKSFLQRLGEHPLGPILDALTVASLGAGGVAKAGTALSKAGKISETSRLAKMSSTVREPLPFKDPVSAEAKDVQLPGLARHYSKRPLRKGIQVLADKLGNHSDLFQSFQRESGLLGDSFKASLRRIYSKKEAQVLGHIKRDIIEPMAPVLQKLSPVEVRAFDLMNRGVNTEERINAYMDRVRSSLAGTAEEGTNVAENAGLVGGLQNATKLAEERAYLPQEVRDLVLDPTKSPALMEATQTYRGLVDKYLKPNIGEEQFAAKANELLDALDMSKGAAKAGGTAAGHVAAEAAPGEFPITSFDAPRGASKGLFNQASKEGIYVDDLLDPEAAAAQAAKDTPQPMLAHVVRTPENSAEVAPTIERLTGHLDDKPGPPGISREQGIDRKTFEATGEKLPRSDIHLYVYRDENGKVIGALETYAPSPKMDLNGPVDELGLHEPLKNAEGKTIWNVTENAVAVDPAYRRQGIASALMQQAEKDGLDVFGATGEKYTEEGASLMNSLFAKRNAPPKPPPAPPHPFAEPTLMPSEFAKGFQYQEKSFKTPFAEEGWFREKSRSLNESRLSIRSIFQENTLGLRPKPAPLLSGLQRPDSKAFVDFLAKHHRDQIEKVYSEEAFNRWAVKDENGEVKLYKDEETMQKELGPGYTFTNPVYAIHWFEREENAADFIAGLQDRGFNVNDKEFLAAIGADAQDAIIDSTLAARKMPGAAVPTVVAKYQRDLEKASEAYGSGAARAYARSMNVWRAATLAFMPRWALNTAVGSTMMTLLKGVNPKDYYIARQLKGQGLFETPELAGVELGHANIMDVLENKAMGFGQRATGVNLNPASNWIMTKVQGIEDYFRRASMVHSLNAEKKRILAENGAIIANFEKNKGLRTTEDYADFIFNHPQAKEALDRALEDVNRFSYNYTIMGPAERRYVRQIVPFWGWYKFISQFAYRLPVDYPGRTLLIQRIGDMGNKETEKILGDYAPDWLKGVLPLGKSDKGVLSYLSTMGLNPLSQFFNPLGPEGLASGAIQLGQASPLLQAGLAAYGIDTMRGGQVAVSPMEGIGTDFFGAMINPNTHQQVDASQIAPGRRFLASLIRSFPEARIAEKAMVGGRSVYPESIPFPGLLRPMATRESTRTGNTPLSILGSFIGMAPKTFDLRKNESLMKKREKYSKTRNKRSRKSLQAALKK